jgi:hypothetical protein
MATLASSILNIAMCLGGVRRGKATGGNTTTLTETSLTEQSDYFNGGTIWFLTGNNAGKSAVITDWAKSTSNTFTFATQSGACAANDRYAAFASKYTREELVVALNMALSDIGPFTQINDTLVQVADQETYDLPSGVSNVTRVQMATAAAAPYQWSQPHMHWRELDGHLYLDQYHLADNAGDLIRLYYDAKHADVYDDTDVVSDRIHPMRIGWTGAWYASGNRNGFAENAEPDVQIKNQFAMQMTMMATKYPVTRMRVDSRMSGW